MPLLLISLAGLERRYGSKEEPRQAGQQDEKHQGRQTDLELVHW